MGFRGESRPETKYFGVIQVGMKEIVRESVQHFLVFRAGCQAGEEVTMRGEKVEGLIGLAALMKIKSRHKESH